MLFLWNKNINEYLKLFLNIYLNFRVWIFFLHNGLWWHFIIFVVFDKNDQINFSWIIFEEIIISCMYSCAIYVILTNVKYNSV